MQITTSKIVADNPIRGKLKLSWQTIYDGIDALVYMIKPLKPHLIVGVSRGGLIPATLLSHRLNCPLETISASAYQGTRRTLQKPIVVEGWKEEYDRDHTIVVDDILDSGDTFSAVRNCCANFHASRFRFASLVTKRPELNGIFFAQVTQDVWIQFPWEQDES